MPLPQNFSPVEHWQDSVRKIYNREVREWFSDITSDELDINSARSSLRTACWHRDDDSLDMTLGRMQFFDFVVARKLQALPGGNVSSPPYAVNRRHKPQVLLFFLEDIDEVEPGYRQIEGRISFRIMDETVQSMTTAKATALATKCKTAFGGAGGFVWKKGKAQATYTDWDKGYQLQLLVKDKTEAKRVVQKVLDIQSHQPDWEYLNFEENDSPTQAYPTLPPTQSILGKSRRLARRRPRSDVRFQYAVLNLAGLPNPIALYDRSGRYPDPLVL